MPTRLAIVINGIEYSRPGHRHVVRQLPYVAAIQQRNRDEQNVGDGHDAGLGWREEALTKYRP